MGYRIFLQRQCYLQLRAEVVLRFCALHFCVLPAADLSLTALLFALEVVLAEALLAVDLVAVALFCAALATPADAGAETTATSAAMGQPQWGQLIARLDTSRPQSGP